MNKLKGKFIGNLDVSNEDGLFHIVNKKDFTKVDFRLSISIYDTQANSSNEIVYDSEFSYYSISDNRYVVYVYIADGHGSLNLFELVNMFSDRLNFWARERDITLYPYQCRWLIGGITPNMKLELQKP